jgi:small subunit ribosomal protein S1
VYNKEDESNRASNSKFAKKTPAGGAAQGEGKLSDLKKPAEKNTLGDLDALSALRDQLAGAERQAGEDRLKARAEAGTPLAGNSPDNAEIQGS